LGFGLFLWGIASTAIPLFLAIYSGRYLFKIDPAILFGACAGARTSTAPFGMVTEVAKSQVPALGYTVTYAISSPLLAMGGMFVVMVTG
jgi:putative transport protein